MWSGTPLGGCDQLASLAATPAEQHYTSPPIGLGKIFEVGRFGFPLMEADPVVRYLVMNCITICHLSVVHTTI
ncbi:hypothetical protein NRB20_43840 [Nocardia sp. RB20]|uniref:Uncharacterized protein n=1 Tax=Nocardia macrotermitis TaxID=2585198 RepID=A0A7K0D8S9_9NOCA|nr:hypothetical protein [Nocardia macrotermitis]